MKKYAPVQYKKAAVMVHGKSERYLASYIYTNLHLPIVIIDNNKGKNSIQQEILEVCVKTGYTHDSSLSFWDDTCTGR